MSSATTAGTVTTGRPSSGPGHLRQAARPVRIGAAVDGEPPGELLRRQDLHRWEQLLRYAAGGQPQLARRSGDLGRHEVSGCGFHPNHLSAPLVRPCWIWRWKMAYTTIIGRIDRVSAANRAAQSASYPAATEMRAMPWVRT